MAAKPQYARLAAWPAGIIDRLYKKEGKGWFSQFLHGIAIRFIYLTLFIPASVADIIASGVAGAAYSIASFFVSDKKQEKMLAQQKRFATIFSKNLLALLAFPIGLIFPKLTVFYFTPRKRAKDKVESGGGYYKTEAEVIAPQDTEETTKEQALQKIIVDAAAEGKKIMPVGAGRSQGRQFLPGGKKGVVVDLKHFNQIDIDEKHKTAWVGAGTRWVDLQLEANKRKLALQVMQASNVFTVGGSIGTNIHGWDHRAGVLSNTILEIEVINAQGETKKYTPKDELFHQITGGLGMFGIVTRVKLKLTDNEMLKEQGKKVAIEDYAQHFIDHVKDDRKVRMHLFRLSLDPSNLLREGIAVSYVREGDKPLTKSTEIRPESSRGTRFNQIIINIARRFGFVRKSYWQSESKRILEDPAPAMTRNEIMRPPINAMFNPSVSESEWLQEYFLPPEVLSVFLEQLGALLMKNEVVLLNASVRFVKQNDKSLFSYSRDGDRFAVVLCFNQSLQADEIIKAKKWLREAQQMALNYGGTFYLPYQQVTSPEQMREAYPVEKARDAKSKVDPDGIFTSGFCEKYIAKPENKPNYFKIIMASDQSKMKFAGFLKNVLQRIDTDAFYTLLEDILKYNDSHEEIYRELLARMPEIAPNPLTDFHHILGSLSTIKADLGAQAVELLGSDVKKIDGLVEIGYPGRFIKGFKDHFKVTGKVVAVHEGEAITDFIQAGLPKPYDQFEKLDYKTPSLANLDDNSADVITCYVGLHHFLKGEKLDAFLKDVRRVLRPGGRFLLVDHDVADKESLAMAHMAHMVFNAVNGVSVEEEMSEVRDFHSMSHWKQALQKHDLAYSVAEGPDVAMIRDGDPSLNRMVCFVNNKPGLKKTSSKGSTTLEVKTKLESTKPASTSKKAHESTSDSIAKSEKSSVSDSSPQMTYSSSSSSSSSLSSSSGSTSSTEEDTSEEELSSAVASSCFGKRK